MAVIPTSALVEATRPTAPLLLLPLLPPLLPLLPARVLVGLAPPPPEREGGELGTNVADGLAMQEVAAAGAAAEAPELTVPLPAKLQDTGFLLLAS